MNNLEKPYRYIYNIEQALFFTRNGADITKDDIAINNKSGNIYFKFKNNEKLQELWKIWGSKTTN